MNQPTAQRRAEIAFDRTHRRDALLTAEEVARHFRVHVWTVHHWRRAGLLVPSHDLCRAGRKRKYRYNRTAVAACQAQFAIQNRPAGRTSIETGHRRVSAGLGDNT